MKVKMKILFPTAQGAVKKGTVAMLCMVLLGTMLHAQTSGTCGGGLTWTITGTAPNQTLTIDYTGSGTGVMTNYSYGMSPWFAQSDSLKTLVINHGVASIGNWAFAYCNNLTGSLIIPNSVTSIGNYAFAGCHFTGTLTIPNSITSIGIHAFEYCRYLTGSLVIPNSVTVIGDGAFQNCSGFTGSLTIGNSVTLIGTNAFGYCSGFTGSLIIPNSVDTIGYWAFQNCSGFTGSLTIGNSVRSIGRSAFVDCNGFTGSLTIPDSVTLIEDGTFYNCRGFTGSLTIPNSVMSIGTSTFRNCSGFTGSLTIPNSVTLIGNLAFQGCSGFTSLSCFAASPPTITVSGANATFGGVSTTIPVYVPCGSVGNYQTVWNCFTNYSPNCYYTTTALANLQQQIADLQNDTANCNQNTLDLLQQINNLQNDTTQLNSIIKSMEKENSILRADTAALNWQIAALYVLLNNCENEKDTLQALLDSCLNGQNSIKSFQSGASLKIYPNPTDGELRVMSNELKITDIQIFDVVGQVIGMWQATSSETTIDISHLASGMYIMKIYDINKQVSIVKIIKK